MKPILTILTALLFANSIHAQILVNATFETGNPSQGVFGTSKLAYYPGYSCAIDSSIARKGSKCVRFELRSTDPLMASGRRAELNMPTNSPINPNIRWFAWSEFLPPNYVSDPLNELHFQIADNSGLTAPNVAMWLRNNRWYVNQKYNYNGTNIETQTEISGNSSATLGGWDDWRIYYLPAIDNTGVLTVYRNGVEVFTTTGPNANNVGGSVYPSRYPNFGIYKWPWNNPGTYNPNVRILYFDEVMFGDSTATLSTFNLDNPPTYQNYLLTTKVAAQNRN